MKLNKKEVKQEIIQEAKNWLSNKLNDTWENYWDKENILELNEQEMFLMKTFTHLSSAFEDRILYRKIDNYITSLYLEKYINQHKKNIVFIKSDSGIMQTIFKKLPDGSLECLYSAKYFFR